MAYDASMLRWTHITLLALSLLVLLGTNASAAEVSSTSENVAMTSEFCGSGKPPVELRCPKTSALKCYCSMSAKEAPVEFQLANALESVTRIRLPKANRRSHLLVEPSWSLSLVTHEDSVPTPPPRL